MSDYGRSDDNGNHRGARPSSTSPAASSNGRHNQSQPPTGYPRRKRYAKKRRPYNITEPITSYGVLLYSFREGSTTPVFLLYQRRDNFEYMDFMRGGWSSEGQLPALLSAMSHEERQRIRDYTFQELWDDLWVVHDCRIYRDGMAKARKKYDAIRSRIPHILDTTSSCIREPPWGWPKGKKNGFHEDPLTCALREFEEETRLDVSSIEIVNPSPYTEDFKGSNGKAYATHYYLAEMPFPAEATRMNTPQCIRKTTISEEASDVQWFTFEEACAHLNPRRQAILCSALGVIEERRRKKESSLTSDVSNLKIE